MPLVFSAGRESPGPGPAIEFCASGIFFAPISQRLEGFIDSLGHHLANSEAIDFGSKDWDRIFRDFSQGAAGAGFGFGLEFECLLVDHGAHPDFTSQDAGGDDLKRFLVEDHLNGSQAIAPSHVLVGDGVKGRLPDRSQDVLIPLDELLGVGEGPPDSPITGVDQVGHRGRDHLTPLYGVYVSEDAPPGR